MTLVTQPPGSWSKPPISQEPRAEPRQLNLTIMVSVQDHIVLITGATSGIGAARVFAQGCKSDLAARRQERNSWQMN